MRAKLSRLFAWVGEAVEDVEVDALVEAAADEETAEVVAADEEDEAALE